MGTLESDFVLDTSIRILLNGTMEHVNGTHNLLGGELRISKVLPLWVMLALMGE